MFFNRNYIPAVPIREEQRLSEEEELARQLKREARIFFPDKKLPDFNIDDLPPLPKEGQQSDDNLPSGLPPEQKPHSRDVSVDREDPSTVLENHDAVCREEDSTRMRPDGSFSHHEIEAVRQEAEQIAKNRQQLQSGSLSNGQSAEEISLQIGGEHQTVRPRLNKQELKRGIRLKIILDKPRGLTPWKEDNF